MKKKLEMKKKLGTLMVLALAAALFTGALAPLAFAEGEGAAEEEDRWGQLPPELQEYQDEVQAAMATLQESMERVRSLAAGLKEGRGAIVSALREKGNGAARAFRGDLFAYMQEAREVMSGMRDMRSGVQGFRGLKRQLAQAVRDGDTDKAVELVEGALARVDEAKVRLDGLAGEMEALQARQDELLDGINAWTPPED